MVGSVGRYVGCPLNRGKDLLSPKHAGLSPVRRDTVRGSRLPGKDLAGVLSHYGPLRILWLYPLSFLGRSSGTSLSQRTLVQ